MRGRGLALLDLELVDIPNYAAGPTGDPHDPSVAMDQDLPWPVPQWKKRPGYTDVSPSAPRARQAKSYHPNVPHQHPRVAPRI